MSFCGRTYRVLFRNKVVLWTLLFVIMIVLGCRKDVNLTAGDDSFLLNGNGIDWPNHLIDLYGDGVLVVGYTTSTDLAHPALGGWDGLVVRLTPSLDTLWTAVLGSDGDDAFTDVIVVTDGFICCGYKTVSGNKKDVWIIKLDKQGAVLWESVLGGTEVDEAFGIEKLTDESYVVSGFSSSVDAQDWGNFGDVDGLVLKIDQDGEVIWSKNFGGSNKDLFTSLDTDELGNIYLAGYTSSSDGDLSSNEGYNDLWLVNINSQGNVLSSQSYGTNGDEYGLTITEMGDFLLVSGAQATVDNTSGSLNKRDWYMALFSKNGGLEWERTLPNSLYHDVAYGSCVSRDQTFLVVGAFTDMLGFSEAYLCEIDLSGTILVTEPFISETQGRALSVYENNTFAYVTLIHEAVGTTGTQFTNKGLKVLKSPLH